ncbi:uncharacterized [Tachysurus ichikawai]
MQSRCSKAKSPARDRPGLRKRVAARGRCRAASRRRHRLIASLRRKKSPPWPKEAPSRCACDKRLSAAAPAAHKTGERRRHFRLIKVPVLSSPALPALFLMSHTR